MTNNSINKLELVFLAIFLQSFSFLSIKYASLFEEYSLILLGLALFFIMSRAYIWQNILSCNELSKVYPFNSLVQVIIFIYAVILFDEDIEIIHILGLILMVFGIMLLGKNK